LQVQKGWLHIFCGCERERKSAKRRVRAMIATEAIRLLFSFWVMSHGIHIWVMLCMSPIRHLSSLWVMSHCMYMSHVAYVKNVWVISNMYGASYDSIWSYSPSFLFLSFESRHTYMSHVTHVKKIWVIWNLYAAAMIASEAMGWLRFVGSLELYVSFAKEPYKRDHILQKRP